MKAAGEGGEVCAGGHFSRTHCAAPFLAENLLHQHL